MGLKTPVKTYILCYITVFLKIKKQTNNNSNLTYKQCKIIEHTMEWNTIEYSEQNQYHHFNKFCYSDIDVLRMGDFQ